MLALTLAALAVGARQLRGIDQHQADRCQPIATRIKVGVIFGVFKAGMPLGGLLAGGEPRGRWVMWPGTPAERC